MHQIYMSFPLLHHPARLLRLLLDRSPYPACVCVCVCVRSENVVVLCSSMYSLTHTPPLCCAVLRINSSWARGQNSHCPVKARTLRIEELCSNLYVLFNISSAITHNPAPGRLAQECCGSS